MMKTTMLAAMGLLMCSAPAFAESVMLTTSSGEKEYQIERKIERQIGPGTTYLRLRLPAYPLNVNVVMVDLNDPYNRIETTVAKEGSRGTELLTTAAKRQSSVGHRPLAAANANFWIVATQPEENVYTGITRNVSLRNGKMITESNQFRDQWDGGTKRTGIVGVSYDKTLSIDYCSSAIKVSNPKFGELDVAQCNKGVWDHELSMYNSHYGASTAFMPIYQLETGKYALAAGGDATEVILDFAEGETWKSGTPMKFVVQEVRLNAGKGTLGNHDLALVGRDGYADEMAKLAAGDEVTMCYSWTFNPGTDGEVTPLIEQAVGGNALVMRNGELTKHNTNETYNSQVYSRTGYGCSADGKTLYMVVIDKSTDPVYGSSNGCSTTVMCEIARHLGAQFMANFDAGGSAELMVNDQIVNKTTEGSPRAVANGWMIYSIAPEDDDTPASLAFYENHLEQPIYASGSPQIIAYNKYGAVISYDYKDVVFSCPDELGHCEGNVFYSGSTAHTGLLTATAGDISVSKEMNVVGSEIKLRLPEIRTDHRREYKVEVQAEANGVVYSYDPAVLDWNSSDAAVADVDAQGVLHGYANGTAEITGTIGTFTDKAVVTVEIPYAPSIPLAVDGWGAKVSSGLKNLAYDAETGIAKFDYDKPTAPTMNFTRDDTPAFYSIPDRIYLDFESTLPVSKISLTIKTPIESRDVIVNGVPENGADAFPTVGMNRAYIDLTSSIDPADIGHYPLTFKSLKLTFVKDANSKGAHTVKFGGIHGEFAEYDGIDNATLAGDNASDPVAISAAEAGAPMTVSAEGLVDVELYSAAGVRIDKATATAGTARLTAPVAGTYVLAANTAAGRSARVIIVK